MKQRFAILVALLALAPVSLAGETPAKDEAPAAADGTSASAPEPEKSEADADAEPGFSIPAADGESAEKDKK